MVKIIKGIYGYKDENGTIEPKTPQDAPFCLTKEQEARLVSKGVAEYVADTPAQQNMEGEYKEEQLEGMRHNDLKELAKSMGITTTGTKADLAKRIAAVCKEDEKTGWTREDGDPEDEEENEEPPMISPEEPQ